MVSTEHAVRNLRNRSSAPASVGKTAMTTFHRAKRAESNPGLTESQGGPEAEIRAVKHGALGRAGFRKNTSSAAGPLGKHLHDFDTRAPTGARKAILEVKV